MSVRYVVLEGVKLDDLPADSRTIGLNQTIRAINEGRVSKVYLADDADGEIRRKVLACCEEHGILVLPIDSMKTLGNVCGIDVKAAVCGILSK